MCPKNSDFLPLFHIKNIAFSSFGLNYNGPRGLRTDTPPLWGKQEKNTKPFYLKQNLKTGTILKENGQFVHIVVYTATKSPFAFAKANLHEKLNLCITYRWHSECVELGIFHHLLFTFANLWCDKNFVYNITSGFNESDSLMNVWIVLWSETKS